MNDKQHVETIFHNALDIDSETERGAYLDRACADDTDLRARVEKLIRAHVEAGDFLRDTGETSAFPNPPEAEVAGTMIGPYRLLQVIGEGGMGTVYLAEQTEGVERRVALKVIKRGLDEGEFIARFEAERQALALMDHPGIAKVFDTGSTKNGRPYFVMELVRGDQITRYCDDHHLGTRRRAELFVQVCHAVHHAHQKGIIHRDIKPANILVTEVDDQPVPKVIDFGVAKALRQKLTEKTMFTEYGQLVGTPEYMSPEQARLTQLDIDTRSDIYSLGVLLYELLTGFTPFDREALKEESLDEILRIIREVEPPKPSTRISTLGAGSAEICRNRRTDSTRLRRALRGELDWIVMRAIEKDRTRRYETANALRLDIDRHLHNEPVLASPPSAPYRLKKFVRRNRTGVMVSGAVAASLVVGLGVATFGFVQANREREAATAINDFFTEMLGSLNPNPEDSWLATPTLGSDDHPQRGEDVSVAELLRGATTRIEESFPDKPLLEAQARETIAKTLLGLEAADDALEQFEKVVELRAEVLGESHREVLRSRLLVAGTLVNLEHRNAAAEMAGAVATDLERYLGEEDPLTLYGARFYASAQMAQGNFAAVDSIYAITLERQRRVLGSDHRDTIFTLISWANRHCWNGNGPRVIELASEARERAARTYGPEDSLTKAAAARHALGLTFMNRNAEAQALARPAIERDGRSNDPRDDAGFITFAYMRSLDADHELDDKEDLLREHFEELRQDGLAGSNWVGSADYTQLLVRRGKIEEAVDLSREVYEYWHALRDSVESGLTQERTDFIRALTTHRYQSTLAIAGRWDEVRAMEREELADLRARAHAPAAGPSKWNEYAWELLTSESPELRDPEEALVWATRAVDADQGADPVALAMIMDTQAKALAMSGNSERALEVQEQALRLCEAVEGAGGIDAVATLLPEVLHYATLLHRDADPEDTVHQIMDGIVARQGSGSESAVRALREAGDALAHRGLYDWAEAPLRQALRSSSSRNGPRAALGASQACIHFRAGPPADGRSDRPRPCARA